MLINLRHFHVQIENPTLLKRVAKLERALHMTEVDEAELAAFDWNGPIGKTFTKYFELAMVRYGARHEKLVGRSWHPLSCTCTACAAFDLRRAPLNKMIAHSRARGALQGRTTAY
jgi:hypothetical protein